MTLLIPNKLQALVEAYLNAMNRNIEMGGYFFGHDNRFTGFLPIPNYAEQPSREYKLSNTKNIANGYAKMLGADIMADMHTHPNGTVPSEQDGRYVRGMSWPHHIVIVDKGSRWEWFVLDRNLSTVQWLNSNVELEAYAEAIASEAGLTYLGQMFLTPKGEVVGNQKARSFISVDADTWRVSQYMAETRRRNQYHSFTYTEISKALGLSYPRVKVAMNKLEAE